jgi:uncharacterized membrane protein YfcA
MFIKILIIAAINFLSAFVQASTGFGYAIVAMFILPLFIKFQQASVISASIIIIIAIQMVYSLRKHIRIKKVIWPMLCCLSTTWLGVYLIQILDDSVLRKIMGAFLIILAVYFYYTEKHHVSMKESYLNGAIVGLLTGIATGMFTIVGPFLTLYYFDNVDSTLEFKANLELSFLIGGIFTLGLNMVYFTIDAFILQNILVSGITVIPAGILGLKLYYKIDKEKLKYIIICILPIMGLVQILK